MAENDSKHALATVGQGAAVVSLAERKWALQREMGKIDRRTLTDVAQAFALYVGPDGQHSTQPHRVYHNITVKIYSALGFMSALSKAKIKKVDARSLLSADELELLGVAEKTVANTIRAGMDQYLPRGIIKTNMNAKLKLFAALREPPIQPSSKARKSSA
jgi:hypothetical protein